MLMKSHSNGNRGESLTIRKKCVTYEIKNMSQFFMCFKELRMRLER